MTGSDFEAPQKLVMGDMKQFFTGAVVDHAMNPRDVGGLPDDDGFALTHSD
ncbi:MAG: hypothetical protein NTX46_05455 [Chloroflexi bacterium]|nr:hypothetical protein [Chloroflexota bacterium]